MFYPEAESAQPEGEALASENAGASPIPSPAVPIPANGTETSPNAAPAASSPRNASDSDQAVPARRSQNANRAQGRRQNSETEPLPPGYVFLPIINIFRFNRLFCVQVGNEV